MTKLCGIYCITHIESGRKYVGQSIDIEKRWTQHAKATCKMRLGRTIAKHGWAAFEASILELCERSELNANEAKWIQTHNCVSPLGFNLTSGGGAYKLSEESRKKIADSKKNISDETRMKLSLASAQQVWSTEAKQKIAKANSRRVFTDEMRQRLSVGHSGVRPSAETLKKMSAAQTGRVITAEARLLISKALSGKKLSPESIAKRTSTQAKNRILKQSLGLPTKQISAETKAKMSASAKLRTPDYYAKIEATKLANRLLRNGISAAA